MAIPTQSTLETSDTTIDLVRCPACNRLQEDRGQGSTCARCGISPLPSFSEPRESLLYPGRLQYKERAYA